MRSPSRRSLPTGGRPSTTPGPTRDHTERLLALAGRARSRRDGFTHHDRRARSASRARDIDVPGDISSAAFWLAAAALHPDAELRIRAVGLNPSRTAHHRRAARDGRRHHGHRRATPTGPEPVGDLAVRGGAAIRGIRIGGARVADLIDELPLLAIVMAARRRAVSELRDAGELRTKESDRIALVVDGLQAIGVDAEELHDGWRVTPRGPRRPAGDATIVTAGDHRIAMAFADRGR